MQRTNFSLDLMNDIRSNKALKDRSKYEYWKLGSISWAMQKIKEKGRDRSLKMELWSKISLCFSSWKKPNFVDPERQQY